MKRAILSLVVGFAVAFAVAALAAGLALAQPPVTSDDTTVPVVGAVTPRVLAGPSVTVSTPTPKVGAMTPRAPSLPDAMRLIWTDHCVWSRMVTMAMFTDIKGCEQYEDRLMDNTRAFRNVFVSYYGPGGTKLADLFEDHVIIGGKVLYALRSDDQAFRAIVADWYRNAEEIAITLHELNPNYWPAQETELLWRTHLDMVLDQAICFSKQDWAEDVRAYDTMQAHALRMADFLAEGIVKQFPPK